MRRALAIAHHEDYLPGLIGDVLRGRGYDLVERAREDDHDYPDPASFDLVVPFGSVWSVHDPELERHVAAEQRFLRAADAADAPVLAICFGAQQLAAALGGHVHHLAEPEIGWHRVRTADSDVVAEGPWMQFHFDAVTPPPGARVLAVNDVCVQAYAIGPHLAVQFHPEVDVDVVSYWMAHGGAEIARRHGVDPDAVVAATGMHSARVRPAIERLVDRVTA